MYKEAILTGLRIPTPKGLLSAEQVATLSIKELDALAVTLQDAYENSKGKSFLNKRSTKDKTAKLQFDIVLDILQTKVDQEEAAKEAQENKQHNAKIDSFIAAKKDEKMSNMTIAQLEKLRK
jgi:hypothetical protein